MKMKLHGKILLVTMLTCAFLMPANIVFAAEVAITEDAKSAVERPLESPEMAKVAQELGAKYGELRELFAEVGAVEEATARKLQEEINALHAKLGNMRLEKALEMKKQDPTFVIEKRQRRNAPQEDTK